MRSNPAKGKLSEGKATVGTWLSLCSPVAARFLARSAFDWLTVDMEHSPYDWETAATILAHVADAGGTPLVRVPAGTHENIKRALDAGAHGFVVPMVMSRAEAERCVAAAKFPPRGNRSIGGVLHALNFDATPNHYYERANEEILVVLQCEHIEAVRRADEIYSVPGVDAVFVGPNDLRASLRGSEGADPTPEAMEAALSEVLAACQRIGVPAGLHCFSADDVRRRIDQGWRFLALGSDLALMLHGVRVELERLDRDGRSLANY